MKNSICAKFYPIKSFKFKKNMKKNFNHFALILALILIGFSACKKDETETPSNTTDGTVNIAFSHVFGTNMLPFSLGKQFVHTKSGDTLNFSTFRYYVSNFKLKKSDGSWWSEPESYYLVDLSLPASLNIQLRNVPAGTYTDMSYTMGVDSLRNVSGAQTGALSVSNGMFWSWNSGYIMLKAEGSSPNSSTGSFSYHLGGFSGQFNIVTVKSASFGQNLEINKDRSPVITLQANTGRLWHTLSGLSAVHTIHMPGADAKQAAIDFYGGVALKSVVQ